MDLPTAPRSDGEDASEPAAQAGHGAGGGARGIYLSWGGEVYGPATEEKVMAGIRTRWFEEGALYWSEGLEEWRPLSEFAGADGGKGKAAGSWRARKLEFASDNPVMPGRQKKGNRRARAKNRERGSKSRGPGGGLRGTALALGFAALTVALTVAILLLLMLI